MENIDHTRTVARHPQTNGIVERFQKAILDEFYGIAFRTKICHMLEEYQADLDAFLEYSNTPRPHQGRLCCEKTLMQTFLGSVPLGQEK